MANTTGLPACPVSTLGKGCSSSCLTTLRLQTDLNGLRFMFASIIQGSPLLLYSSKLSLRHIHSWSFKDSLLLIHNALSKLCQLRF